MFRVEQVGSLAVAFNRSTATEIERELKRLDPNLFLDYETNGRFVYPVVMEWVGERHVPPALPVLSWRDATGPKPLTMALVEQVRRMEKRDERLMERIHEANAEAERRLAEESSEAYDEITRDFDRHAKIGHFTGPIPRSRGLYLARARARERRGGA